MTAERHKVTLASYVPIDNILVRGALRALRWLSPELGLSIHPVASLEVALREALELLEANGMPFAGDRRALRRGVMGT
jgi:hypothetical protein